MPELATRLVQDNLPGYPNAGAVPPGSRVEFTLSQPVFNASNGKDENMVVVAPINPITGDMGFPDPTDATRFGARLFCNDDPNCKPQGTFWRAHYVIPGPGPQRPDLAIVVSTGNTDPVNLATLAQPVGGTFSYGIRVKEIDGAPDVSNVMTLIVSNNTLTDNGGQSVTLVTGGGGGGGGAPPSTVTPLTDVAGGAVGTATPYTREDHRHPLSSAYATAAALTAEASTARAAESANASAITSEASTARAAESANATAITNEASTARAAEATKFTIASNLSEGTPATMRGSLGLNLVATLLGAVARVIVNKAGTLVGTRRAINFIEGTNVTLTVADNAGAEAVDVTINAASGGGASFPLQSPGGDTRGTQATDLQTTHTTSSHVASGDYATIGGGRENTASGLNCTVGGGTGNTASGNTSTVAGGNQNTSTAVGSAVGAGNQNHATGYGSTVAGGEFNTASNDDTTVAGGTFNTASAIDSTVGGGDHNTASGRAATVPGGYYTTASLYGQHAGAAGRFAADGDAQWSDLVARAATTDATATELFLDGAAATQRLTLAANRASAYRLLVIARQDTGAAVAGWEAVGVMNRITGGHIALSGNSVTALGTPPAGWAFAVTADTTNDALKLAFTGAAATNVHVVARVLLTEVV